MDKEFFDKLKIQSKLCEEVNNMGLSDDEYARVWKMIETAVEVEYEYFKTGSKTMDEILTTPYFVNPKQE